MRAVVTHEAGGPEVLTIEQVETPAPARGQVLIRVAAAGVNRADILQREGHYPPPPGVSDVIGLEVSGHIAAVGEDVVVEISPLFALDAKDLAAKIQPGTQISKATYFGEQ